MVETTSRNGVPSSPSGGGNFCRRRFRSTSLATATGAKPVWVELGPLKIKDQHPEEANQASGVSSTRTTLTPDFCNPASTNSAIEGSEERLPCVVEMDFQTNS